MHESKPGAERRALARILETPHLAAVVPQLAPEILHRVIQTCGLEDCGDLVALATPAQLVRLLDLDLWHAARPGRDEVFDAARFGVWLEVLVEMDAAVAAQKLAEIDAELVIAGIARHARVFDRAAAADYETTDGDLITVDRAEDHLTADVGGYLVVARGVDAWDALVSVLIALEAEHPRVFGQIMAGVLELSDSAPEIDGLDDLLGDADQVMYDVAIHREDRRVGVGYVATGDARAFLEMARHARVDAVPAPAARRVEPAPIPDAAPVVEASAESTAAVVDLLIDAGIIEPRPTALLAAPQTQTQTPRLVQMQAQMQYLFERDRDAYLTRNEELGHLANTLVAGCSIQGRPFSPQEAWDAAVAASNLGLERIDAPDGFLRDHDMIGVFQVGWTVLHDDVAMYVAERLTAVLAALRCRDRLIQADVDLLRRDLAKHMRAGRPWQAREAMEVLSLLDMPAWAALLGLIDECPVLHGGLAASRNRQTHAVSASAFECISERAQIVEVHAFMDLLPAIFIV